MKRFVMTAAAALAMVAGAGGTASAQETEGGFFRNANFAILPGAITSNVISCDNCESHTGFNARFQSVITTSSPWLAFVGGAQWGPASDDDHGAIIFLGGIIPIVPLNNLTNGMLAFSIDPLLVATGPGSDGMDFVLEGAAVLSLGKMMAPNSPFWSNVGAFFLLDQNITTEDGEDSFNPVLVYGLSIPIAP